MTRQNTGKPFDLVKWRKEMGLTQRQASFFLGYASPNYYQHLERGRALPHELLKPACMFYAYAKTIEVPWVMKKIQRAKESA